MSDTENLNEAADSGLLQPRLVRQLIACERVETDAIAPAWPTPHGRADDCWVVEDRCENVLLGYGHDDRALVPRSSVFLPNAEPIHGEKDD